MKYDPIMCMNIPDSVKTNDTVPNGWKVTLEQNRNKYYVYSKAMTARSAELEAKKVYPNSTVLNIERCNVRDANYIDEAIRNCDAENGKWITMNGSHVKIDGKGNAVAGNEKVKNIVNKGKRETKEKTENKVYKSYNEFKKESGAKDLIDFVDEVAFDTGRNGTNPNEEDLRKIGKEFKKVYEKIKDHPGVGKYVNEMRREMNGKFEEEVGTSLYDYSLLGVKELNETLNIFNKYNG